MPDQPTMQDHIDDLMIERNQLLEQVRQWRDVATMFYTYHDNRRSCSLIVSCKQCDAYEALIEKEN